MMRKLGVSFLIFSFSCLSYAAEDVFVSNAWIPQAAPVAKMHAGYLEVKNQSNKPITIVSASATDYAAVEIHKTVTEGGMARMIEQKQINLAAGETVKFERGGLHLMLMQPKRKLNIGDEVKINLLTQDKQTIAFTATVKAATLDDDHSHHHHHH